MEKYQENWKNEKFKRCEIGNMENSENVKKDNRNKCRNKCRNVIKCRVER